MKLGDVLKKERTKKDLSPAEMATALGVSESDYERLEAGKRPRWDEAEIRRRLLAIGVDLDSH